MSAWLSPQILCPLESRVVFLHWVALQGEILALDIGLSQTSGTTGTMAHSSSPVTLWWAQPHPSQMHPLLSDQPKAVLSLLSPPGNSLLLSWVSTSSGALSS